MFTDLEILNTTNRVAHINRIPLPLTEKKNRIFDILSSKSEQKRNLIKPEMSN